MAYEMAVGEVPFTADSAVEIMAKHISTPPAPLRQRAPWVPPAFEQLVHRMLDKDARARPPIAEVAQQLAMMRAQPEIANAATISGGAPAQWTPALSAPMRTPPMGVSQVAPVSEVTTLPAGQTMPPPARKGRGLLIGIIAGVVVAGGAAAFLLLGKSSRTSNEHAGSAEVAIVAPVKTEPVKTEPVKTEPATTEPAGSATAVGSAEPAKVEPTKVEPTKVEPTKVEPTKVEPTKVEPTKVEPTKVEPTRHPAAKLGTVVVSISGAPRGTVWVDGKQVASEVAEASLELSPGEHKVRVQAPGHKPFVGMVHVDAGAKKPLAVQLKKQSINTVHDPFAD